MMCARSSDSVLRNDTGGVQLVRMMDPTVSRWARGSCAEDRRVPNPLRQSACSDVLSALLGNNHATKKSTENPRRVATMPTHLQHRQPPRVFEMLRKITLQAMRDSTELLELVGRPMQQWLHVWGGFMLWLQCCQVPRQRAAGHS